MADTFCNGSSFPGFRGRVSKCFSAFCKSGECCLVELECCIRKRSRLTGHHRWKWGGRVQWRLGVFALQWMNKWLTLSGRCQVRHHSRWGGAWLRAIDAMIISTAIKQLVCLYMSPLIGCSPLLLLVLSVCQCWELQIAKTHCKQCVF